MRQSWQDLGKDPDPPNNCPINGRFAPLGRTYGMCMVHPKSREEAGSADISLHIAPGKPKHSPLLFLTSDRRTMRSIHSSTFLLSLSSLLLSGLPPVVDSHECRLWLAPSYTSNNDNPAFGLYAGRQGFQENEVIPSAELSIPIFDYLNSPAAHRSERNQAIVKFIETNSWVAEYGGSQFEANHSTSAFIPGIGALAMYHSGYSNVEWAAASLLLREADAFDEHTRRTAHPSRGAVTPYHNATLVASKSIPGGMELLGNYGDVWDGDKSEHVYQDKITRNDYEEADKVLDRILAFMEKYKAKMDDKLKNKILDFMLDKILGGADGKHAKTIRMLLPDHPDKLQRVKDAGGTFLYHFREMVRSDDWLEEHGLCVDYLEPKMSTIPDAGRGAFSKRSFEVEEIISPVPMMAILFEEVLEHYNETREIVNGPNGETSYELDPTKYPKGMHLIYNYCYGHPESNLLLIPTAPIVNYINHAPTKEQVNAALVWSKHDHLFNDHHLHDTPLQRWSPSSHPPITMMLVATKEIKQGDEVFIDYGDEWAAEYAAYKKLWDAQYAQDMSWPLKAVDIRGPYKEKPYPVDIKQGQQAYPDGVLTACFLGETKEMPDGEPHRNHFGQPIVLWTEPKTVREIQGRQMSICDVVGRQEVTLEDGSKSYEYNIITKSTDFPEGFVEFRKVPHHAITLTEKPYTGDIHTDGAFRRYINLDDQKFPQEWRNLRD